jgi:hypothetical protein
LRFEAAFFELFFEGGFELFVAIRIARAAAGVFFPLVAADEDVVGELSHACSLQTTAAGTRPAAWKRIVM